MKKRMLITMSVLALALMRPGNAGAASGDNGTAMIMDVVVARPLCLAATAIGSVFFVVSLPFALMTKSVNRSAEALVVTPAKATFTRPLGDFEELMEY